MLPDDAIEMCGLMILFTQILIYISSNQILHRQNQTLFTFTPRHADRLSHEGFPQSIELRYAKLKVDGCNYG